jgi:hypothetical protein
MEIANIVSNDNINIGKEFNVVKSIDEIMYKELPTMIIGRELAISSFSNDSVNILNRQINKNTFWTLNKNVKRDVHSIDLENFIRFSYKNYLRKINYVDVDFIQYSESKMQKVKSKLFSLKDPITYLSKNNVLYVYGENIIFGLDLNTAEYIGLDPEKISSKLIKKSNVFLYGDEIFIEYNNHLERLNYEVKYIPVLYSINPNE